MPRLFSYGSLQQEKVQLSTVGRRLDGHGDELLRFEHSSVAIDDPEEAATVGATHHANVRYGNDESRVHGMVFEITDAELTAVDEYEAASGYRRVALMLASGGQAWVYIHGESATDDKALAPLSGT
jgi:gamma-glutamylcyclotransferase (GGCT)/AIG2-like uncharacterized protein YtfP